MTEHCTSSLQLGHLHRQGRIKVLELEPWGVHLPKDLPKTEPAYSNQFSVFLSARLPETPSLQFKSKTIISNHAKCFLMPFRSSSIRGLSEIIFCIPSTCRLVGYSSRKIYKHDLSPKAVFKDLRYPCWCLARCNPFQFCFK